MQKISSHKTPVGKKQSNKKCVPATKSEKSRIPAKSTKQVQLITLLKQSSGVSLPDLIKATGWQAHSIRGYISGTLKKRLNLNIINNTDTDGLRRYRIEEAK